MLFVIKSFLILEFAFVQESLYICVFTFTGNYVLKRLERFVEIVTHGKYSQDELAQ